MSIFGNDLKIAQFQHVFDNKSECYKLFWFRAILDAVHRGETELVHEDLIDQMICDAWYMVCEYKLNLGPKDTLELLVRYMSEKTGFALNISQKELLTYLKNTEDPEIHNNKVVLTLNVPYRFLSPFIADKTSFDWKQSPRRLAESLNQQEGVIYRFTNINSLESKIRIEEPWGKYFKDNYSVLDGWVEYNFIDYLQKRNPSVPGIPNKLHAPKSEVLADVKKYWSLIIPNHQINEIYKNELVDISKLSIDHFVPWSYVAHDELWNLTPTTKPINSSKSNKLPNFDCYFSKLANLEYRFHQITCDSEEIQKEFERCANKHIDEPRIKEQLYRRDIEKLEFTRKLEELIKPVYIAAQKQGFEPWNVYDNN